MRSGRAMKELVEEWGPKGVTVEQLESVVGSPADKGKKGAVSYRFDTGYGGQLWVFETRDGKIVGWRVEQLE